jgi:hypothetical protein
MKISVGKKLYLSILSVFLVFAVAFIVFQQDREKQFKIDTLNLKLQDYNSRMEEYLRLFPDFSEEALDRYVETHYIQNIRVTLIRANGDVLYDSKLKDYSHINNHSTRPEIAAALKHGAGSTVDRNSETVHGDFFYSATYFPKQQLTYGYIQHVSQRQKQRNIRQPLTCLPTADGLVGQLEFICQLALRPALSAALRSNESTDFCGIHV